MKTVDAHTLTQWLSEGSAELVDVREPVEHHNQHIAHSHLHPLGAVGAKDITPLSGRVVIYCQKGARGGKACAKLLAGNPQLELYNLEGGIEAWTKIGQPVISGDSPTLPIERQVQITVGSMVLLGSVLAYWVNPAFVALSGFFGAGLLFAGLSGTCGLGILLTRMPWNRVTS